ncbi:LysR family transcriptional regulator [Shimia abyssi]|uniref:LysR substrate binding domain-containing protein n=1 Tax=Shimia abyssi TaxID=1662395 RepID=A0A2P8FEE7_9RHOB|nr:LysR family transcriptional regulator [Shimia abyssi]PSL20100.1 LysR substrate binding domain-containing protein [Shimia abyssi]
MDIRQIKCFVAVAEELHFRRAAERIGVAQAVLSAHVKRLEEELGFPLLFRTTRHVSLTQVGYVYLEEVQAVLAQLERAVEKATIAAHSRFDNLRIGGFDAALIWFLPPILHQFQALHPGIQLRLTEGAASGIQIDELSRHHIDLAFFRPPTAREGIEWETLI